MKNKNRTSKIGFLKSKINIYGKIDSLKIYNTLPYRYNLYIINNLIFNINSRKVSHFKDFLLYDDPNEFLRRFYNREESDIRLKYYISFYEENNKFFPNYYSLPESKYLYKNLQQKHAILNNRENLYNKYKDKKQSYSTIFSSSIKRSIYNESEYPSNSISSTGNDSLKKLIRIIYNSYSLRNYIKEKEKSLKDDYFNNFAQKSHIKKNNEKFNINNNLLSFHKSSLISNKKNKNVDNKKNLKFGSYCLSDRDKNMSNKHSKYKRVISDHNRESKKTFGNIKNSMEIRNNNVENKEKIKNLIKTIKLMINKNDSNLHKRKNINNNNKINEIDNININKNNNKSVLNSIIQNKKNNKNNIKKNLVNQSGNLKHCLKKKIKIDHGNSSYKTAYNKVCSIKNEFKTNKNLLNHIKNNSNLLSDTISKINNTFHTVLTNNNSVSFNIKSISMESFPQISSNNKSKNKIIIKNCQNNKRKNYSKESNIKDNRDKNRLISESNFNKKYNKFFSSEIKKDLNYFSSQINFKTNSKFLNKNISKDHIPKTIDKFKSYKKEKRKTSSSQSSPWFSPRAATDKITTQRRATARLYRTNKHQIPER